jgi:hypothetical protein
MPEKTIKRWFTDTRDLELAARHPCHIAQSRKIRLRYLCKALAVAGWLRCPT